MGTEEEGYGKKSSIEKRIWINDDLTRRERQIQQKLRARARMERGWKQQGQSGILENIYEGKMVTVGKIWKEEVKKKWRMKE